MFKMFALEPEIYIPKVLPGAVKSFVNLQGDGGPGTLRLITFSVDKLPDTSVVEKLRCQIKFEISPDERTICKRSCNAYAIDDVKVKEDEIRAGLEKTMQVFYGSFKLYEAYALANPDA
ncbi:hypothetical protein JCGZ_09810 [Jatropha curcas]|uniref:Bet v I/Major latex protein domain-containing protein n=1 Tax=Jatropha curcas TaxID=180498 RepID=A0A067KVH9_JATCU|nr:hypothetical protein JCGZ_09810 [Jatropha curcas]